MKNITAIVQARMGSTRLPYKMMLCLHGHPIIEWVLRRVQKSKKLNAIIAAIPTSKDNDILDECISSLGFEVYRGSEDDVLDRFYNAAIATNASHIVRICADNPLIVAEEIDNLIDFYKANVCDYAYNHIPKNNTYPDGFGAEIISFALLELLNNTVTEKRCREHCFSFITDNSQRFIIKTFNPPDKRIADPSLKFDIDTFDDYYTLSQKQISIDSTALELVSLFRKAK